MFHEFPWGQTQKREGKEQKGGKAWMSFALEDTVQHSSDALIHQQGDVNWSGRKGQFWQNPKRSRTGLQHLLHFWRHGRHRRRPFPSSAYCLMWTDGSSPEKLPNTLCKQVIFLTLPKVRLNEEENTRCLFRPSLGRRNGNHMSSCGPVRGVKCAHEIEEIVIRLVSCDK